MKTDIGTCVENDRLKSLLAILVQTANMYLDCITHKLMIRCAFIDNRLIYGFNWFSIN